MSKLVTTHYEKPTFTVKLTPRQAQMLYTITNCISTERSDFIDICEELSTALLKAKIDIEKFVYIPTDFASIEIKEMELSND